MPETPRWLVQKGRLDEARRVLARLGSRDGTLEEAGVRPGATIKLIVVEPAWAEDV